MIDDFKYKQRSKRVDIKLVSNQTEPLSSIDLTSLLRRMSSLYYKTDLLNSIAVTINQGVGFEDICILRKSLQSSFLISNLRELHLFKQTELLYRHGFIESLSSNKELYEISLILDGFKEINSLLYRDESKTIFTRLISRVLETYYDNNFNSAIDYLFQLPGELNNNLMSSSKELIRGLNSLKERSLIAHKTYIEKYDDINKLKEIIEDSQVRVLNSANRKLAKNYIEPFFDVFRNNDFPIVLIKEEKEFSILCHYHFNQTCYKNPLYFDIIEVSHNSPTLIEISLAVSVISPFLIVYLGILKTQKTYWEKEKAKEETKSLRANREKKKLIENQINDITELIKKYSISEKIYDENINFELERIASNYYKEKLLSISNEIKQEYEYIISDYSFFIKDLKYL